MTREFNKQRRDDARPSFRNKSSNRHGEERSAQTDRPRLSREIVDRGWESGAQQRHADYRPRSNNGPAPRNNWRSEHSPSQNSQGNRPYNKRPDSYRNTAGHPDSRDIAGRQNQDHHRDSTGRQDTYRGTTGHSDSRDTGRQSNYRGPAGRQDNYRRDATNRQDYSHDNRPRGPHTRPFGADRRNFEEPRGERRGYSDRQGGTPRPGFRGAPPSRGYSDQSRTQGYGNRRNYDDRGRPPRDFGRKDGPSFRDRNHQPQTNRPDTQNPRWQSRPWAFKERETNESPEEAYNERFEGDYERFNQRDDRAMSRETRRSSEGRRFPDRGGRGQRPSNYQPEPEVRERHVTRLPDGRVITGSRPEQRKKAQFWTGITQDTETLVQQVQTPEVADSDVTQLDEDPEKIADREVSQDAPRRDFKRGARRPSSKSAKQATSASARKRKAASPSSKPSTPSGPRPSQRGFKWPSP